MNYGSTEAQILLGQAEKILKSDEPPELRLKKMIWMIMRMHGRVWVNSLRPLTGDKVYSGPFRDMILTPDAIFAYMTPILLGTYEHELHPVVEKIVAENYTRILNIGCAVGYYAVGLAYRMPKVTVNAFDIDMGAQKKCTEMVAANGLQNRVCVGGQFFGEDFAKYENEKTLVVMDIEGAEKDLLDPDKYPALRKMDMLVELHDVLAPGISKMICDRFASTHTIEVIQNKTSLPDVSKLLPEGFFLDPYDHVLLGWEGRDGNTPWGLFRAKDQSKQAVA